MIKITILLFYVYQSFYEVLTYDECNLYLKLNILQLVGNSVSKIIWCSDFIQTRVSGIKRKTLLISDKLMI